MGAKASLRRLEWFTQTTVPTGAPDEDKFVRCLLGPGGCRLLNRMPRLPEYGLNRQSGAPNDVQTRCQTCGATSGR
jgi:hypothetical protein